MERSGSRLQLWLTVLLAVANIIASVVLAPYVRWTHASITDLQKESAVNIEFHKAEDARLEATKAKAVEEARRMIDLRVVQIESKLDNLVQAVNRLIGELNAKQTAIHTNVWP